jgi:tocopherol O-methyltransferase
VKSQNQIIANYYNQTQNHYQKWWRLEDNLSLHYGIWDTTTKDFNAALANTNTLMHQYAGSPKAVKVLDAGCGVGGAAIYLAQNHQCTIDGLSLSEKQLSLGQQKVIEAQLDEQVFFHLMDFTQTTFESASYDLIWACESVCHTSHKNDFIKEAYRLLKPGGKVVMTDFFLASEKLADPHKWIQKWAQTWGVPHFSTLNKFTTQLEEAGFDAIQSTNYTEGIRKSAKKMHQAALLGALPSELYNLFNPQVSTFAKTHYKSGLYQYKALQAKLWGYEMVLATKSLTKTEI